MSLDKTAVAKIAKLARLKVDPDRQEAMTAELNNILKFVEELQAVKTGDVEPMTSVIPMKMRQRDDVVTDGDRVEAVLKNAPGRQGPFYTVPRVVE